MLNPLVRTRVLRSFRPSPLATALLLCGNLVNCSGYQDDMAAIDGEELEESNSNASAITAGNLVDVDYFNANNHAQATVRFDPEGNTWCSGTKIGPHRFLTAAHCVDATWVGATVHITNRLTTSRSSIGRAATCRPRSNLGESPTVPIRSGTRSKLRRQQKVRLVRPRAVAPQQYRKCNRALRRPSRASDTHDHHEPTHYCGERKRV